MEKKTKILASILAFDPLNLEKDIIRFTDASIDGFHIDLLDGHFSPNITFGLDTIAQIVKKTSLPVDIHLQMEHPFEYAEKIAQMGVAQMTFHYETTRYPIRFLHELKAMGVKAGVAICPSTEVVSIKNLLSYVDHILMMTVEPGYGNAMFLPFSYDRIQRMSQMKKELNPLVKIGVDGGVNIHNSRNIIASGADYLISGSGLFKNNRIEENIKFIRGE